MKLNKSQQKTFFFFFEFLWRRRTSVFHLPIYPDKHELLPASSAGLGQEGTQTEWERVRMEVSGGAANRREQPQSEKEVFDLDLEDSYIPQPVMVGTGIPDYGDNMRR